MLAHQLPALPPFPNFWSDLEALFDWLSERTMPPRLEGFPMASVGGGGAMLPAAAWAPPATVTTWGLGVPLETVRFAAANHLCVRLHYQGTTRVIEPYSLRRTQEGNLLLHGVRVDNREPRAYRVDRIQGVEVTNQSFTPIYRVEFSTAGAITAAPVSRPVRGLSLRPRTTRRRGGSRTGPTCVYECPLCEKHFRHSKVGGRLNAHKDRSGGQCFGRVGYLVDTEY
jgi:WYL domain